MWELQRINAVQSGFQQANAAVGHEEIAAALDNLAIVVTMYKELSKELITSNRELTAASMVMGEQIKVLVATNAKLVQQLAANSNKTKGSGGSKQGNRPIFEPNGYCWSHGFCIIESHSSKMCTVRKKGHGKKQEAAMWINAMGGSQKDNNWVQKCR